MTSIGSAAFFECNSLTEIIVDFGNKSYASKSGALFDKNFKTIICYPEGKIGSFTIPDSVTNIEDNAFSDCTGLTSIIIPNSIIKIKDSAFFGCTNLTSITIPNSVTSIGYWAFSGCTSLTSVMIPDSVTSIDEYTFYGCTSLTSVTIPNSIASIGMYAFYGCTSLMSITIPDSVTNIEDLAFLECNKLTEIIVDSNNELYASKDGVLFDKKFRTIVYCPEGKIGSFTIPDSVTNIENSAFSGCNKLTEIIVDSDSELYAAEDGVLFDKKFRTIICFPGGKTGNFTIPDSVTSIEDSAFAWCTGLISVTIPDSVTSIGYWAFSGCTSLTSVMIPDSVTSIGDYAFYDCIGLTNVTIPDSVTSIGDSTFQGCTNLTSVTIPDSVTSIGWDAFDDCDNLTDIYYSGTESEWNQISIGDSAIPSGVTIHYESEPVTTTTTTTTTLRPNLPTIRGDVDGNNTVEVSDAVEILNYYSQKAAGLNPVFSETATENEAIFNLADVDKDGEITVQDAVLILTYYAKAASGGQPTWEQLTST